MQSVFLLLWPPFSFSVGPVDPSVRNPGKNTAVRTYWGMGHLDYYLCLNHTHKECMSTTQLYSIKYWGAWAKALLGDACQPEVRSFLFKMPWRYQVWNAKCIYSHRDDMSEVSAKLQKTSSLKLPIHSLIYFAINHIRIHQQYTRNLKYIKDNRHYSN